MTDNEKRQQRAMLLLEHEETRQELELTRNKAWSTAQLINEVGKWLEESREMTSGMYREQERDQKIAKELDKYREAFNFDAVVELREELRRLNKKFKELTEQKKALGLGG